MRKFLTPTPAASVNDSLTNLPGRTHQFSCKSYPSQENESRNEGGPADTFLECLRDWFSRSFSRLHDDDTDR